MPSQKSKSKYSDIFQIRGEKATCNKCGKILQMKNGNTTGLAYHINKVCQVKIIQPQEENEVESRQQQSTLDSFVKVEKPTKEDIISREAALGATFNFVLKSPSIKKNMNVHGFNHPRSSNTVRMYVHTSATKHRQKVREKIKKHLKNGHRFCALTDEWTCPVKKRKFLNVQLHLKGNYSVICHTFVWQVIENQKKIYFVLNTLQL